MQLRLNKNNLRENAFQLLRRAGYAYQENRSGQGSYVLPFGRSPYPHFHLYVEETPSELIFNLHLDQKQPSYGTGHAHSGEYEGELVEREIARLRTFTGQ